MSMHSHMLHCSQIQKLPCPAGIIPDLALEAGAEAFGADDIRQSREAGSVQRFLFHNKEHGDFYKRTEIQLPGLQSHRFFPHSSVGFSADHSVSSGKIGYQFSCITVD